MCPINIWINFRLFKHKNNLSELYLNDNEITAIDSFTFDATSLKILHMDNNNLSKVAINFTNASKLEELSFRNCSLEKLIAVAPVLSILR
jgi:Leucine-rich repeat (LRR) protein